MHLLSDFDFDEHEEIKFWDELQQVQYHSPQQAHKNGWKIIKYIDLVQIS